MRSLRAIVIVGLVALGAGAASQAAEPQKYRVVYYTSYKCPEPADKTAPGATPGNPIAIEYFDTPIDDQLELNRRADEENKERTASRFYCKWIRFSGFFTPTNYYHYRGDLVADAWSQYKRTSSTARYLVDNFSDPAMRRAAIGHRQVTVVGQFYYLCLTAPRGDDILFLFGPCHYSAVGSMMLAHVRIEKIEDDAPRYLVGEANRSIIGRDFPPVEGEARTPMSEVVRKWAASVQRGPKAYARETDERNSSWLKQSAKERADDRARIVSPDSYASYLYGLPALGSLDAARAPVAVFWTSAEPGNSAVGCICLKTDCADQWPLTEYDADSFYGHAACTRLEKRDVDWTWWD